MNQWQEYEVEALIKKRLLSIGDGYRAKNSELSDKGIPFARAGNLNGGFDFSNCDYFPKENLKKVGEKKSQVGDVVFTSKGTVGRFAFVDEQTPEFVFSPQLCYWRSLDESFIYPQFLYYWMQSRAFTAQVYAVKGQTDMADYVSLRDQRQMSVTLPEIKTQKEIASIFSDLDQKIALLQHQNQTLEKIAQTLFKHWFIDFEFPNEEGKPYRSSGGKMVASEFGEVPEGWYGSEIGELIKTLGGGTPSTSEPEYWMDGQILWYSPTDLTKSGNLFSLTSEKKITDKGLQKSSAKLFPAYSIMMTSRATVGEIAINTKKACTNQGFITLIPNDDLPLGFLFGWLKTQLKKVKSLASGSTFPELSKGDFREFEILVPRQEVVLKYEKTVSPLLSKIENNTIEIQSLTKTRDTLLPKLMNGQIRIQEAEKQIP